MIWVLCISCSTKLWLLVHLVLSYSLKLMKRLVFGHNIINLKIWEARFTLLEEILEFKSPQMKKSTFTLSTRRHLCQDWKIACSTSCSAPKWCSVQEWDMELHLKPTNQGFKFIQESISTILKLLLLLITLKELLVRIFQDMVWTLLL